MRKPTTRDMSAKHEDHLAEVFNWRRTKNSGAVWNDQMDGRHDEGAWKFAGDGKSTFGRSIGVTREMWGKALEQSHGARPLLPLRWYRPDDYSLTPVLDLVVCDLNDLAEMISVLREGEPDPYRRSQLRKI